VTKVTVYLSDLGYTDANTIPTGKGEAMKVRCTCGYEEMIEVRPGFIMISAYHVHRGGIGYGSQAVRMQPAALDVETVERREVHLRSGALVPVR
jgi:hypothetical protein